MIDAPGGTGKTFLCNVISACVRKNNNVNINTALSGVAATLLKLGTTSHRIFGSPIPCFEDSSCTIKLDSEKAKIIAEAKIVFVDECSMMSYELLDCLNRFLKTLMNSNAPMGGKLIVLMGDFRQILPVVIGSNREDVVKNTVKCSELWNVFQKFKLTENMRVKKIIRNNPEREEELLAHANWLLKVGDGEEDNIHQNIIKIPQEMVSQTSESLRDAVYDDFANNFTDPNYLSSCLIMSELNRTCREAN